MRFRPRSGIVASPDATIIVGDKRVLVRPDGSLGAHVPLDPEEKGRAKRRKANKRAKAARKVNRAR